MKLYLDTSALVKLYVEEEGSATVREAIARAETVATTVIVYVEACAAFARRRREDDYREATTAAQSTTFNLTGTITCFLKSPVSSFEGRRI